MYPHLEGSKMNKKFEDIPSRQGCSHSIGHKIYEKAREYH